MNQNCQEMLLLPNFITPSIKHKILQTCKWTSDRVVVKLVNKLLSSYYKAAHVNTSATRCFNKTNAGCLLQVVSQDHFVVVPDLLIHAHLKQHEIPHIPFLFVLFISLQSIPSFSQSLRVILGLFSVGFVDWRFLRQLVAFLQKKHNSCLVRWQ